MINRTSVIKGLEDSLANQSCGYMDGVGEVYAVSGEDLQNAITLLKGQEPVKPVNIRWEAGINGGNCPKCMNWIRRFYNYCPFCGKGMEWDATN